MSLIKIAGRDRIFSPLRIEAKLIENLVPLGLFSSINDLKMHNYFQCLVKFCIYFLYHGKIFLSCKLFVTVTHS